jgi:uncharacterized protein (DUF2236 family)
MTIADVSLADINIESYIFFGAGAAVAWQLAYPGVGRGVARHSQTLRRPVSRLRATMSYIYAVSLGTEADRATIAHHVNRAHVPVQGEGYSAFDRDLQLWVAATLYRGGLEMYALFVGPVPAASRESLYRQAWAFGRTLHAVLGNGAPWYLRPALPLQAFVTRALLPPHVRTMFELSWTDMDERRWARFRRWAPRLYWLQPRWLRHLPAHYFLAKLRRQAD